MALTVNSITVATKGKRSVTTRAESELASKLAGLEVGMAMVFGVEYDDATAEKIERLEAFKESIQNQPWVEQQESTDAINMQLAIQALENATLDSEVTKLRSLTYHVMARHVATFATSRLAMSVNKTDRTITISHLPEARKASKRVTTKTVDVNAILASIPTENAN